MYYRCFYITLLLSLDDKKDILAYYRIQKHGKGVLGMFFVNRLIVMMMFFIGMNSPLHAVPQPLGIPYSKSPHILYQDVRTLLCQEKDVAFEIWKLFLEASDQKNALARQSFKRKVKVSVAEDRCALEWLTFQARDRAGVQAQLRSWSQNGVIAVLSTAGGTPEHVYAIFLGASPAQK